MDPVVGVVWWLSSLLEVSVLDRSVRKLARDRLRSSLKLRKCGAIVSQVIDLELPRFKGPRSTQLTNGCPQTMSVDAVSFVRSRTLFVK